jgi:hypothetical protein
MQATVSPATDRADPRRPRQSLGVRLVGRWPGLRGDGRGTATARSVNATEPFEFTVTGIQPPVETVGEDFLAEEAQGQFIIVRVTVTNVGDEARTLHASSRYLYDADGRRFETSSALFTLEDADKVFLENINPNNTVADAPLLYDVPE